MRALGVAGLFAALAACGGEDAPREVTLAVLAADPAGHDGAVIATQGEVRHFDDPLHYWIEDADLNRVEIFPHEAIAPHLGERVRVVGEFQYAPAEGRRLTLESVEVLQDGGG
ncbi:glucose-inhibited division protein B [Halomonas campisalis]|uniref:Glucose-inhibited division protein B n=1 Tax=Billgrantia campisalis TaxID=74661 RepID=A0ABS9P858_9GAMM|nr:glucose-inhibited division protein B [Halomonas campisalis]